MVFRDNVLSIQIQENIKELVVISLHHQPGFCHKLTLLLFLLILKFGNYKAIVELVRLVNIVFVLL